MPYKVKEIFGPTLQGEGLHAGKPCLFLRLSGCNAWDGRAETRADSACPYCDTDFRGGEMLNISDILSQFNICEMKAGLEQDSIRGCVLSGGEPLLQADSELLQALAARFDWVDIETNGTRACPEKPDNIFISCSPKAVKNEAIIVEADWWKILIPVQEKFLDSCLQSGKPIFLQPCCPDEGPHGAEYQAALERCYQLCYQHNLRLSLQQHKYLNIP